MSSLVVALRWTCLEDSNRRHYQPFVGVGCVMYGVPEHIRSETVQNSLPKRFASGLVSSALRPCTSSRQSWENGIAESFNSACAMNFSRLNNSPAQHMHAFVQQLGVKTKRVPSAQFAGRSTPAEFARRCAASASAAPPLQQHKRQLTGFCLPQT